MSTLTSACCFLGGRRRQESSPTIRKKGAHNFTHWQQHMHSLHVCVSLATKCHRRAKGSGACAWDASEELRQFHTCCQRRCLALTVGGAALLPEGHTAHALALKKHGPLSIPPKGPCYTPRPPLLPMAIILEQCILLLCGSDILFVVCSLSMPFSNIYYFCQPMSDFILSPRCDISPTKNKYCTCFARTKKEE